MSGLESGPDPTRDSPSTSLSRIEAVKDDTRRVLTSVHGLLAMGCVGIVSLVGGGWAAFAQVRTTAAEVASERTNALALKIDAIEIRTTADASATQYELTKLRSDLLEVREDQKAQRTETRGIREDLRVVFPTRLGALPPDGGR